MKTVKQTLLTNGTSVFFLAMISCLLWGSAFPCIKIGYRLFGIQSDDVSTQLLFAGIRFSLAGILVIIIASLTEKKFIKPSKKSVLNVLCLAFTHTVIQYLFFYIGLAHTTGVKSSIIKGSCAFITILISCYIFKQEKFTFIKLAGCILGFAGTVVMNLGKDGLDPNISLNGEGFILFSNISSAFSSCMIKKYSQRESPVTLSGYQFLVGGIIMSVYGYISGGRFSSVSPSAVCMLLYLASLSAIAYSLWGVLIKHNSVSKMAIYSFMNPVFGVFLSAILLGESNMWLNSISALIMIGAGVVIVNKLK